MTVTQNDTTTDSTSDQSLLGGLQQVRDAITVRRVFGDAYEPDGVTIIPVAHVRGGGGGGAGENHDEGPVGGGFGTGFGINSRPVGVYEVRNGTIEFRPAIDISGLLKGAQVLAATIAVCVTIVMRAKHRSG